MGINIAREVEDINTENFTMLREIKSVTNSWKDILYLWIERNNIVKMCILFKAIYRRRP